MTRTHSIAAALAAVLLSVLPGTAVSQVILTYAGNGFGEGQPGTRASVLYPRVIGVDAAGSLYVDSGSVNSGGFPLRKVDGATGLVSIFAGGGDAMAFDSAGNLYFALRNAHQVRRVDAATRAITVFAGSGQGGHSGDGGPAVSASLTFPGSIAVDAAGNVYIAEVNYVRKVDASTGIISTIAGNGGPFAVGDGIPATQSSVGNAVIALDGAGNLYLATNDRVRKVLASTGYIVRVAGGGSEPVGADPMPATSATLDLVTPRLAVDPAGNFYFAVAGDFIYRVRASDGYLSRLAGDGTGGYGGDGVPAAGSPIIATALALDGRGGLLVAESAYGRVRRIDLASGIVRDHAGYGRSGDGVVAASTGLNAPTDVAFGPSGDVYVSAMGDGRIRRIDRRTGIITTVAGSGIVGFYADPAIAPGSALGPNLAGAVGRGGGLFGEHRRARVPGVDEPPSRGRGHRPGSPLCDERAGAGGLRGRRRPARRQLRRPRHSQDRGQRGDESGRHRDPGLLGRWRAGDERVVQLPAGCGGGPGREPLRRRFGKPASEEGRGGHQRRDHGGRQRNHLLG